MLTVAVRGVVAAGYNFYPLLWSMVGLARIPFIGRRHRCIELGAGPRKRAGFLTVDCSVRCDLPWDLRLKLPFEDQSADLIYAEHVLEHFDHRDLVNLLDECFRILRPGGAMKISVPDVRHYVNAYLNRDESFKGTFCQHAPALNYYAPVDYLNYMFYMNGEHRTMFDPENLRAILISAGATIVRERDFDPNLDRDVRRHESLLVEAIK